MVTAMHNLARFIPTFARFPLGLVNGRVCPYTPRVSQ